MYTLDPIVITLVKDHGQVFLMKDNLLSYFVLEKEKLIRKSLPFITVYNSDEAQYVISQIGDDCTKNIKDQYIQFYDSDVVSYKTVTAPFCYYENGHYQNKSEMTTANVPSLEMLEAAELIYWLSIGPIIRELTTKRIAKFKTDFNEVSLDGKCAVIKAPLDGEQIPKEFTILTTNHKRAVPTYFVIRKDCIPEKSEKLILTVHTKDAGFIIGPHGKNIKRSCGIIGHDISIQKK